MDGPEVAGRTSAITGQSHMKVEYPAGILFEYLPAKQPGPENGDISRLKALDLFNRFGRIQFPPGYFDAERIVYCWKPIC